MILSLPKPNLLTRSIQAVNIIVFALFVASLIASHNPFIVAQQALPAGIFMLFAGVPIAMFSTNDAENHSLWSYPPSWSMSICTMAQGMAWISVSLSLIVHFRLIP